MQWFKTNQSFLNFKWDRDFILCVSFLYFFSTETLTLLWSKRVCMNDGNFSSIGKGFSTKCCKCGCKIQTNRALQTVFVIFNCSVTSPQCQHNSQIINNINFQNCFLFWWKKVYFTRDKKIDFWDETLTPNRWVLSEAGFFKKQRLRCYEPVK